MISTKSNLHALLLISMIEYLDFSITKQLLTYQYARLYKWLALFQSLSKPKNGSHNGVNITFITPIHVRKLIWLVILLQMEVFWLTSQSNILIINIWDPCIFLTNKILKRRFYMVLVLTLFKAKWVRSKLLKSRRIFNKLLQTLKIMLAKNSPN